MMQFVWFCASGDSFFLGAGLLALAAALPMVRRTGQAGILILCAAGVMLELEFRLGVDQPRGSPLWVIGDSVSAGIQGPNEVTWPKLLSTKYQIEVINLAEPGATVDLAHLSALGHEQMADQVARLLGLTKVSE